MNILFDKPIQIGKGYTRAGLFGIGIVLASIPSDEDIKAANKMGRKRDGFFDIVARTFCGIHVKMNSLRYRVFRANNKCVRCGIEGAYFALEKSHGSKQDWHHFNLYALNENGDEVMMTKDHILPKSKGGKDHMENMQTMCAICNSAKGNEMTNEEREKVGITVEVKPLVINLGAMIPVSPERAPVTVP